MKKYTYVNDKGESVQMGAFTSFLIERIEGVSDIDNQISTQKGMYQDGNSISNKTLDVRYITIEGAIDGDSRDEIESLRRQLVRVFNAKFSGVFIREYQGVTRKINCEIDGIKFAPEGIKSQRFLINLVCNDPFWSDIDKSEMLSAFINLFKFPLSFPMEFGAEGSQVVIDNKGDITTPIKVIMRGSAVNPSIVNLTTGEFIKINKVLGRNDELIINTAFGNKQVTINGINVYPDMTLDSTLFEMDLGENIISYETDSGEKDAHIEIQYKNKFIGI